MREIKFRAWDITNKKMIYWRIFDFVLKSSPYVNLSPSQLRPMQFTGLKDKNGKEIYEGDILSTYDQKKPNKQVCYNDTCEFVLKVKPELKTWNDLGYVDGRSVYKVIGNIYENPELLKK